MNYIINIEPKPQSRPRFTRNGHAYEVREMKQWKDSVRYDLFARKTDRIEQGAIYIGLVFYIYPPQRVSKAKQKHPLTNNQLEKIFVDKKSDLDNYVKAILDASNGILYKDDGQIAILSSQKLYSYQPRIDLTIEKLENLA